MRRNLVRGRRAAGAVAAYAGIAFVCRQGSLPYESKNAPVGPSSVSSAAVTIGAAPCSTVWTPRKPLGDQRAVTGPQHDCGANLPGVPQLWP